MRSTLNILKRSFSTNLQMKKPLTICVTGSAGNIGYSHLFRAASGQIFGPDQPVIINLLDIPQMQNNLMGVKLELLDCAFPTCYGVNYTDKYTVGFKDVDYCFLFGAKPRGPGMERGDLLSDNGKIFVGQGQAIDENASENCKIVVIGNPANTNALIAKRQAKRIPKENFTAMTKLDHNRALGQLAMKTDSPVTDIKNLCIWGNHSPTMYPDLTNVLIKGKNAYDVISDESWIKNDFLKRVQQRGAEIIKARGSSSAASAASASIDHVKEWHNGTNGEWTSFAIPSEGNPYGIPDNLIFSFPVTCDGGKYKIVEGLKLDEYSQERIELTTKELLEERKFVEHLL